jgi:hypothetical protein
MRVSMTVTFQDIQGYLFKSVSRSFQYYSLRVINR